MKDPRQTPPFKTLGTHLKYLREQMQESLAEVSGAVEIDEANLERIEEGLERPSEEILMLLISHFNIQDIEAVQVWELAGYSRRSENATGLPIPEDTPTNRPIIMLMAVDMRTQYTDGVEVHASQAGVVINFTQAGGQQHTLPVARLGMSIAQAEAVAHALQTALLHAKYQTPKALPSPNSPNHSQKDA